MINLYETFCSSLSQYFPFLARMCSPPLMLSSCLRALRVAAASGEGEGEGDGGGGESEGEGGGSEGAAYAAASSDDSSSDSESAFVRRLKRHRGKPGQAAFLRARAAAKKAAEAAAKKATKA